MRKVAALLIALAAARSPSPPCTLSVDPATGTDATPRAAGGAPWRSLAAARDAVRALPRPLPAGGVVVCVAAGLYSEPLILEGARDSGDAEDRRIMWVGATAGAAWPRAELTAGVRVTFAPGDGGVWRSALRNFGVTDFGSWQPHGFLFPAGGCPAAPLELFSDGAAPGGPGARGFGQPMVVARWPNVAQPSEPYSEWTAEESWDRAAFERGEPLPQNSAFFASRGAPFQNWSASIADGNVFYTGFPFFDWADASLPVRSFNASSRLVSLAPGLIPQNVSFSAKYFLQNAVEALDAPGEYWLDPDAGVLHFIPPAGVSTSPLVGWVSNASAGASLLSLTAVAHVTLANLAVSFARGSGVTVAASTDVVLLNLTVSGMGARGISVSGSNGTVVAGATVTGCGGGGISSWGGGDRATLTSSGVVVVDSTVQHFGRRCLSYEGGISVGSVGGVVAHNDVSGGPHVGARTETNDGLFEFNVVHDTVLAACDMAAFYVGAPDWSVWNTTIRFNLFYRNGFAAAGCNAQSGRDVADIYFDVTQSGADISSNVHFTPTPPYNFSYLQHARVTYAHLINGGSHVAVSNSLVLDANISFYQSCDALGRVFATACNPAGSHLLGMHAMRWNTGVFAARYPALAALQGACDASGAACAADPSCPAAPFGGAFASSATVNVSVVTLLGVNASVFDPRHFNFSGLWAGLDPRFAAGSPAKARETLSFQLEDDSPVYAAVPGFRRIPMECFGPRACSGEPAPYPRAAALELQLLGGGAS
jgi:hypothetical protein